jgi:thiopeptide-type bacteriocin biosynthesis protein
MGFLFPHRAEDFFVLRSPSLPMEFLEGWSGADDREGLKECLRAAVRHPAIREALFLASPDLEAALDPWLNGTLSKEKAGRVDRSLVRYLSRMAFRCTPFGLFAGVSTGRWGAAASLELGPWASSGRKTRMDMDAVAAILASLEARSDVRAWLTFRPNTSLHSVAGRLRYMEARGGTGRLREYHLVDLQPSDALRKTLEWARPGAGLEGLAESLALESDADLPEARAFCGELVAAQVLVGDLQPTLTGGEVLAEVADRLRAHEATAPHAQALGEWGRELERLDQGGPGASPETYRALARVLDVFPVPLDPARLFQVDQFRPAPGLELPGRVRSALEVAVDLLRRLAPPKVPGPLEAFREAFVRRYDRRLMPLLEVLDSESGVGFGEDTAPSDSGQPLLENLPFPGRGRTPPAAFGPREAYLLRRVQGLQGTREWVLTGEDVAFLENPGAPAFPAAFAAVATLAAASREALESGEFQVLMEQFSGPSGARLLARFCPGDAELARKVQEHLREEEAARPGVVFAEILHLPDGRTGNILARPAFREYEIPILGAGSLPEERQLRPEDLLVTVLGDRVVLWSRRLDREVVPRLSSAHNYGRGLPVYRFLARLQDQEGGSGAWAWGCLRELPFLPRVVRGRHVLAKARWRLERGELEAALREGGVPREAFGILRRKRGLPRWVVLEDLDNTLLVDLDQALWVETLWHLVASRAFFILTEVFPGPGLLPATGPEGHFTHELVVPFRAQTEAPLATPRLRECPRDRSFPPGSEWLYLKLYCGPAAADRILLEAVAPLVEGTRRYWDKWFFVRYSDPDFHLRLRFHGVPAVLLGEVLPRLRQILEPLRADGLGWKLQLDTYEREVERYGGLEGMGLAEAWFRHDSEAVLAELDACVGDEAAHARWRKGLAGVDRILGGLGLDLAARARLVGACREAFLKETGPAPGLEAQLGAKFRPLRAEMEALVMEGGDGRLPAPHAAGLSRIGAAARAGRLEQPLEDLASSLVHMHLNRLLRTEHRAQECVLLDFLSRVYTTLQARAVARV